MRISKENLTSSSESLEYMTPCIASIVGVGPRGNFCEALAIDGADDEDPFPAILASSLANFVVRDELSVGFEFDVSCINNSSDILYKIDSEKHQTLTLKKCQNPHLAVSSPPVRSPGNARALSPCGLFDNRQTEETVEVMEGCFRNRLVREGVSMQK